MLGSVFEQWLGDIGDMIHRRYIEECPEQALYGRTPLSASRVLTGTQEAAALHCRQFAWLSAVPVHNAIFRLRVFVPRVLDRDTQVAWGRSLPGLSAFLHVPIKRDVLRAGSRFFRLCAGGETRRQGHGQKLGLPRSKHNG